MSENMTPSMAAKQVLRKNMKQILNSLPEEAIKTQSAQIFNKLTGFEWYRDSSKVGVYLSMKEEVQTDSIVEHIFTSGKQCFIPWYDKDVMKLVKLESLDDLYSLPLTKWNIRQPKDISGRKDAVKEGGLDVVLVPGLGFTKCGKRLGRGKGYYDKFLTELAIANKNNSKLMKTVGLAFREQIVEDIPCADHDMQLDIVLTPD